MGTAIWFPPADLPANTNVAFRATVVKVKPEFWSLKQVLTVYPHQFIQHLSNKAIAGKTCSAIITLQPCNHRKYERIIYLLIINYEYFQKDFSNSICYPNRNDNRLLNLKD